MCNLNDIKMLIHTISGQDNYFTVNKVFVQFMGSLEAGIFLSQLIYWSDRSSREDGYFYKSYKEWEEEIFISEYNIRKYTKKLKEMGVVETKVKKANSNPTLHYKVDVERLSSILVSFLKNSTKETENVPNGNVTISESNTKRFSNEGESVQFGNRKFSETLTKTTTEITTKITHNDVDDENARENAFQFYEQNGFGLLNLHIAEKISTWIDVISISKNSLTKKLHLATGISSLLVI